VYTYFVLPIAGLFWGYDFSVLCWYNLFNKGCVSIIRPYTTVIINLVKAKSVKYKRFQIIIIAAVTFLTIFVLAVVLKELLEIIFIGCIITAIIIGVSYFVHRKYRPSITAT
jgi:hypothetical protein